MSIRNAFRTGLPAALTGLLVLAAAGPALAQPGWGGGGWGDSGWGPHYMMYYGGGWIGTIMMFLFWGLIIVGLVFVVRWLIQASRQPGGSSPSGGRALDILKERYARGEINREEFERMKQDLGG